MFSFAQDGRLSRDVSANLFKSLDELVKKGLGQGRSAAVTGGAYISAKEELRWPDEVSDAARSAGGNRVVQIHLRRRFYLLGQDRRLRPDAPCSRSIGSVHDGHDGSTGHAGCCRGALLFSCPFLLPLCCSSAQDTCRLACMHGIFMLLCLEHVLHYIEPLCSLDQEDFPAADALNPAVCRPRVLACASRSCGCWPA